MVEDQIPVALLRAEASRGNTIQMANIDWITVLHQYRNKGLGRQMLTHYIDSSRSDDVDLVTLGVHEGNPAKRLYESLGFRKIRESEKERIKTMGLPLTERGIAGFVVMQMLSRGEIRIE